MKPNILDLTYSDKAFIKKAFTEYYKLFSDDNSSDTNTLIFDCYGSKFMGDFFYMPDLMYLDCSNTLINSLPILEKLIRLECRNTNLSYLPDLPSLTYLDMSNCRNIKEIPVYPKLVKLIANDTIISEILSNIEYLEMTNSKNILNVPESVKILKCSSCDDNININTKKLEEFVGNIDISKKDLGNAKSVKLHFSKTEKLPVMKNLEYLELDSCDNIENIENIENLKELVLKYCTNLTKIGKFENLQEYTIIKCKSLEVIPIKLSFVKGSNENIPI